MSSSATDGNQSPAGKRQAAIRQGVHLDKVPFIASDDYAGADLETTRDAADWGPPVDVRGRDTIELLLTLTVVGGLTLVTFAMQASPYETEDGPEWFGRHTDFNTLHGDSVAIPPTPRDLTLDVSGFSAGVHRVLTEVRTFGHYMQFKPFGAGTVVASRAKIEVLRIMEGS